jgi:dienelactone hydrolase
VQTVEYASGRLVDLFGDPEKPTVLMWHGAQTNARLTMRPLAERVAGHGFAVAVADWDSHAEDGGRADLLQSLQFARDRSANPDDLVLVGWSLGGAAAAGATIHAARLDVRIAHTVCLAGAFMVREAVTGQPLPTDLADYHDRTPFTLLHGAADDVVPIDVSQEFAATLRRNQWPVEVAELATDHGAIAGATYDSAADRYAPGEDAQTLAVADDVAARIASAAAKSGT